MSSEAEALKDSSVADIEVRIADCRVLAGVPENRIVRRFQIRPKGATLVGVCFALFAVLILVLSNYGARTGPAPASNARLKSSQLGTAANATAFPYLVNASLFPAPVRILNGSGNATLPQLAVSDAGTSAYDLLWAQDWLNGTNDLEYSQARYNTSLALSIYNNTTQGGCVSSCPPSLPLSWGTLGIVAAFGKHSIQADALATRDFVVAAAATVGGKTYAYLGYDYGDYFPWRNLTSGGSITGLSPKLAISPCTTWDGVYARAVLMTTLSAGRVTATTFPVTCAPNVNVSSSSSGHPPGGAGPNITSLYPTAGTSGTVVTINGTGFTQRPPIVTFNGVNSPTVTWVSASQVTAAAPTIGAPLVAPVQVESNGLWSPIKAWTFFDYQRPAVTHVSPSFGPPGTQVALAGLNFTSNSKVFFGNTSAGSVTYLSPTNLLATSPIPPPNQAGSVNVTVLTSGGLSADWSQDLYTYVLPSAISKTLTGAVGAAPFWSPGPNFGYEGIVVANASSGQIVDYNSSNLGQSFATTVVGTFSPGLGSNVFSQIGSTRLDLPGGPTGQVTAAAENSSVLVGVTTESQGVIALETTNSQNGGLNWSAPYLTEPPAGSVSDPQLVASPAGYYYATWRDDGAGDWQVDQTVFSEEGRVILSPQVLLKSGGPSGYSAQPPTVAVDALQRALFAWGTPNVTGNELRLEGAFPSAATAVSILSGAFANTTGADYLATFGGAQQWKGVVGREIGFLRVNVTGVRTGCNAALNLVTYVYPNVMYGAAPGLANRGYCSPTTTNSQHFMANTSGPLVAGTYLEVYADWIGEAIGWGAVLEPAWAGSPTGTALTIDPLGASHTSLAFDSSSQGAYTPYGDLLNVTPITETPTSILFRTALFDPGGNQPTHSSPGGMIGATVPHALGACSWTTFNEVRYVYVRTVLTLTNHSGSGQPLQIILGSHNGAPWVYVMNLSGNDWGTWTLDVNATGQHYWGTNYQGNCLGAQNSSNMSSKIPQGFPGNFSIPTSGTFLTSLEIANSTNESRHPTIVFEGSEQGNGTQKNFLQFNTSIRSSQYGALNYTQNSQNHVFFTAKTAPNQFLSEFNASLGFVPVTTAYTYVFTTRVSTLNGTPPLPMNKSTDVVNAHSFVPSNYTGGPMSTSWTCSFAETVNPIVIGGNATNGILNVTATTAKLTWMSNYSGEGWATYHELGGMNFTAQAQWLANTNASKTTFPDRYQVELHGLHPWGIYTVQVGVASTSGCLTYENWLTWHFQTLTQVALEEQDQPYDSITQRGGGAVVEWQAPVSFVGTSTFTGGFFEYWPWNHTNQITTISFATLPPWIPNGPLFTTKNASFTFGENLTTLNVSWQYNVSVVMNFTVHAPWGTYAFAAGSLPFRFWYLKDTSGDGLTDAEKIHGWQVTYQAANDTWMNQWVAANPSNYSTNGLTSDYLEKEYGLNPQTVDTAGSHMLDTWNLTFDLGLKSHALHVPSGANFQYWDEAGTLPGDYNWNNSCQYFVTSGTSCLKGELPLHFGWTNLTTAHLQVNSSRVLWSWTALSAFINMSGVRNASWLRAVLGNDSSSWTLTVEGKLSWGANPLATSTPRDGIADGARVDPLYDENLVISSLSSNIYNLASKGCPNPGSGSYDGWAPRFYLNYSIAGQTYYELPTSGNYTRQANDTHGSTHGLCGSLSNWQVAIPIAGTTQNQTLQAGLILHYVNGATSQYWAEKLNGTGTSTKTATVVFDTVQSSTINSQCTWNAVCHFSGPNGTLNFSLSVAPAGVKDSTFVWLPTGGGTLSNLPWGLKRYAGEQAFDFLQVDQTSGGPLALNLPSPLNGSLHYSISVPKGLNTFVIPRQQFLGSDLGQGLALGRNLSWNVSNPTPPLLNSSTNSTLSSFGSMTNPLHNLACYWQNRAINSTAGSLLCSSGESDTPWSSPENVASVVFNGSDGANTGGVPGTPQLETPSVAGAAVQSIFTFNVSSRTELDLLLASLMDNTTGGINGTLLNVTFQVPCLGLVPVVTNTIANATFNSSGLFGAPVSHWTAPAPPPCTGAFCLSNLVSGITTLNGIFYSYVWSPALALATLINDHMPTPLKSLGAWLVQRTTAALAAAVQVLANALNVLIQVVKTLITALFSPTVTTQKTMIHSTSAPYVLAMGTASNDAAAGNKSGAQSQAAPIASSALAWLGFAVVMGALVFIATQIAGYVTGGGASLSFTILIAILIVVAGTIFNWVTSSGIVGFQEAAIWATDGLFNCTSLQLYTRTSCGYGSSKAMAMQPGFDALADIASVPQSAALWTFFGAVLLALAGGPTFSVDPYTGLGIILSIFGLILTYAASVDVNDAPLYYVMTIFVDSASVWADVKGQKGTAGLNRGVGIVDILLDAGTFVYDAGH